MALLGQYPPHNPQFTDENDHNPLVVAKCPVCFGTGSHCEHREESGQRVHMLTVCSSCNGEQYIPEVKQMFDNNSKSMPVRSYSDGWVKCPNCGRHFALKDPNAWTGRRCRGCGQKLHVIGHELPG